MIFDLTILQRTSSPKGCRGPLKLASSALSLFLAAPAVYLLRLAAARAIAAPLLQSLKILSGKEDVFDGGKRSSGNPSPHNSLYESEGDVMVRCCRPHQVWRDLCGGASSGVSCVGTKCSSRVSERPDQSAFPAGGQAGAVVLREETAQMDS